MNKYTCLNCPHCKKSIIRNPEDIKRVGKWMLYLQYCRDLSAKYDKKHCKAVYIK